MTAGVIAELGRVRNAVAHVIETALVEQIHDQLELVHALEVSHFWLVSSFYEGLEARLDQFANPAAKEQLARRTSRFRFLRQMLFQSHRLGFHRCP